jgi:deoxyribonuclease-4
MTSMPRFGAHTSIAGGLHRAIERATALGCDTVQIFLRNNMRWRARARTPEELAQFKETLAASEIEPVVAHAIYLINLASPEEQVYAQSTEAFAEELSRCHEAGIPFLVLHPGSHKGTGLEEGIARIARTIDAAYEAHPEVEVVTLLENTAGQGNVIGKRFEELAQIAAQIEEPARIGYCFDTAHALAAGYELRTPEGYQDTFGQLERVLGLGKLHCFHVNDSRYDLNEGADEHRNIGEGYLDVEAFRMLVNDPRFAELPMILETPTADDMSGYEADLKLLRSLVEPSSGT